jgi:hypothetical protein
LVLGDHVKCDEDCAEVDPARPLWEDETALSALHELTPAEGEDDLATPNDIISCERENVLPLLKQLRPVASVDGDPALLDVVAGNGQKHFAMLDNLVPGNDAMTSSPLPDLHVR